MDRLTIYSDMNVQHQQLETYIAGELIEQLDLKNQEVYKLKNQVDAYVKKTNAMERRMLLGSMRKKKR